MWKVFLIILLCSDTNVSSDAVSVASLEECEALGPIISDQTKTAAVLRARNHDLQLNHDVSWSCIQISPDIYEP